MNVHTIFGACHEHLERLRGGDRFGVKNGEGKKRDSSVVVVVVVVVRGSGVVWCMYRLSFVGHLDSEVVEVMDKSEVSRRLKA